MTKEHTGLRNLREVRGLSVNQVAELINISESQYYNLENGYRGLTFKRAYALAKLYRVSLDDLAELYFSKEGDTNGNA